MGIFQKKRAIDRELHFGTTEDGWQIALHRLPHRNTKQSASPVLLCHGLGANRHNLDAPGHLSLAEWLWNRGHDCWVVELRGAGHSSRPSRTNSLNWSWTFDDYVRYDLKTALDVIQVMTGRDAVHWVGHSMGGMLAYAFMTTSQASRVRSATTIGSPSFAQLNSAFIDLVLPLRPIVKKLKRLPYEGTGLALIPAMPLFRETIGRLFGNPRNMRNRDLVQAIRLIPSDLPTSLILQFADWYGGDGFQSHDGDVVYWDELERVKAPVLLIVGQDDRLSPLEEIRSIHDAIGSEHKSMLVLSRDNGCRHDYGHIDPVFGRWASQEVWPAIDDWIQDH